MKLIIGLGNPEEKYKKTRHNAGFMVVDELIHNLGVKITFQKKFNAEVAESVCANGEKIIMAKPQTYMNNSGSAVAALKNFFTIPTSDIVVVHDDVDIPFGILRIRKSGSSGGHNGVESIMTHLGTDAFIH